MRYLVDTHFLIWLLFEPAKISNKVREVLANTDNEIFISSVSFWEISIKYKSGKLNLANNKPDELLELFESMGFDFIDLSVEDAMSYYRLELEFHKDPFDRMLVWQAIQQDFILVTDDKNILKYKAEGLKTL